MAFLSRRWHHASDRYLNGESELVGGMRGIHINMLTVERTLAAVQGRIDIRDDAPFVREGSSTRKRDKLSSPQAFPNARTLELS